MRIIDSHTRGEPTRVILDGGPAVSKSAMMPPWSKTLSEAEVDGLIQHLRKLCGCEGNKG